MVSYHGGKQKTGKYIAREIYGNSKGTEIGYCEPFCGMLGVYNHMPIIENWKYLAGDLNGSVVKMWKELKLPQVLTTRDEFLSLKCNGETTSEKGFIGHFYGYRGKYFQPFYGNRTEKQFVNTRNKVLSIARKLENVEFSEGQYEQYSNLENFVIYCDSPYKNGSCYYDNKGLMLPKFDTDKFLSWCLIMARKNTVFVSEYAICPSPFKLIWQKGKEKLYILDSS